MKKLETLSVDSLATELEAAYHKPILFRASDPRFKIRRISTQIPALDRILGGGIPLGRTVEFYGPFSAGKSLVVWHIIAEAQQNGMLCALADTEKSFDPTFVEHLGVDLRSLMMLGDTEKGEEMVDYIEWLMRSRKFGVIALDSVAALLPKAELEKSAEENTMGRMGQLTSRMMRKLTAVNTGGTAFVVTNQVRDAIGVMWGNPERPTGGKALGHYASQRVEFRQGEALFREKEDWLDGKLKKRKVRYGSVVRVLLAKDKTGPNQGRDASFKYYLKSGRVDFLDSMVQLAIEDGLVEVKGLSLQFAGRPDTKVNKKSFMSMLKENDRERVRLAAKVTRNHRIHLEE
jgi:recombination protein RecA